MNLNKRLNTADTGSSTRTLRVKPHTSSLVRRCYVPEVYFFAPPVESADRTHQNTRQHAPGYSRTFLRTQRGHSLRSPRAEAPPPATCASAYTRTAPCTCSAKPGAFPGAQSSLPAETPRTSLPPTPSPRPPPPRPAFDSTLWWKRAAPRAAGTASWLLRLPRLPAVPCLPWREAGGFHLRIPGLCEEAVASEKQGRRDCCRTHQVQGMRRERVVCFTM